MKNKTGKRAWYFKMRHTFKDKHMDSENVTLDQAFANTRHPGAIEGVFLTTAELDTLVAEAEARGAELMKQESLNLAKFLANGRPKLYVADFLIELSEKTESVTTKAQAHTQRQRDEGYNEALVEANKRIQAVLMKGICACQFRVQDVLREMVEGENDNKKV